MASLTMSLVIVCRDVEGPLRVEGPAEEKRLLVSLHCGVFDCRLRSWGSNITWMMTNCC